jgi:hypothetical protein
VVKMGGTSYFLACKIGISVLNRSDIMKRFDKGGKDSCTVKIQSLWHCQHSHCYSQDRLLLVSNSVDFLSNSPTQTGQ